MYFLIFYYLQTLDNDGVFQGRNWTGWYWCCVQAKHKIC